MRSGPSPSVRSGAKKSLSTSSFHGPSAFTFMKYSPYSEERLSTAFPPPSTKVNGEVARISSSTSGYCTNGVSLLHDVMPTDTDKASMPAAKYFFLIMISMYGVKQEGVC